MYNAFHCMYSFIHIQVLAGQVGVNLHDPLHDVIPIQLVLLNIHMYSRILKLL